MENSVFCRLSKPYVPREFEKGSPFLVENYSVTRSESGESKLEISDPVVPSLASEFDVISNSLRNRIGAPVIGRDCFDPVDFQDRYPEFFNN